MQRHTGPLLGLAAALLLATGCDDPGGGRGRGVEGSVGKGDCNGWACEAEAGLPVGPLAEAFCEIEVRGEGSVPTETEYLANVIYCENGDADLESLKAMAIAARSVAYWEMGVNADICDDDRCQVFSCPGEPSPIHYRAVEETSGMYLFYGDEVTYGFNVRGSETIPSSLCQPVQTEEWVTHNLGRQGEDVEQTELGWVSDPGDAAYGQNRGCMSRLGMQCLASELDYDYEDILRYYYGADIQIGQAQGECVKAIEEDDDPDATTGSEPGSTSSEPETGSDSGFDTDSASASETDADTAPDPDPDTASDTDGGSDSDSDSDGRPPRPSSSDSDADTAASAGSESETASASDTDASSDTDATDTASSDTEASDTDSNDGDAYDPDDGADPWGGSDGGDWPDDDYEPGGAPTPWGDDGGSDTDTETDGAADSQRSGCSVSGAGAGEPPAFALGLLLLGLLGRRKRGPARH